MWMKLSIGVLNPKEWGWKINGSTFTPNNDRFGSLTREPAYIWDMQLQQNPCGTNLC